MKILCADKEHLPLRWISATGSWKESIFAELSLELCSWIERTDAEKDDSYRQIIPYILIISEEGRLLGYPRHGFEQRLAGLFSFGLGGHIEQCDLQNDLLSTIKHCAERELSEELINFDVKQTELTYRGIINEIESEVGRVHLGVVFTAQCKDGYLPLPAEETKGGKWFDIKDINQLDKELWSILALNLINIKLC